jgi:hypothetical protein
LASGLLLHILCFFPFIFILTLVKIECGGRRPPQIWKAFPTVRWLFRVLLDLRSGRIR